jgi:hypothetical protein
MSAAMQDGDRSTRDERVARLLNHLEQASGILDQLGDWHEVGARLHEVLDAVHERRNTD